MQAEFDDIVMSTGDFVIFDLFGVDEINDVVEDVE